MLRQLTSSLFVAALALLITPLTPVMAQQSRYTFTRIADSREFSGGLMAPPAINDSGTVSFVGSRTPGVTGVFTGRGGRLSAIADTTGPIKFFGFPGINGLGQATFFGNRGGIGGYFAGDDGATTIVDQTGAVHGFGGDIHSSTSGSLSAVQLFYSLPRPSAAIVAGDGGHVTTIADTSGLFGSLDRDPTINRFGQVAFHGTRRDGSEGIFVGQGGRVVRIADTSSGQFLFFMDSPAINDKGDVLFQAFFVDPVGNFAGGLFLSSRGKTRTVIDTSGAFIDFGFCPALNKRGEIAFQGSTQDGLTGIFTGPDPVGDRVIAVGDTLDGSTVAEFSVLSFRTTLNNKGQIAFHVQLADGRAGVYRADPVRRYSDDGDDDHDRH